MRYEAVTWFMGELIIPPPSFHKYLLPSSVYHQLDLKFRIDLKSKNLELVCNSMTVIIHDISPARGGKVNPYKSLDMKKMKN